MWDPRGNEAGPKSGSSYSFEFEEFEGLDSNDQPTDLRMRRWLLSRDEDPNGGWQQLSSEQQYGESLGTTRSAAVYPILGTWCDGSSYTRAYRMGRTTTVVTRETSEGRKTTYATSLSDGSPRTRRLGASGGNIESTRTDPDGWFVTRTDPSSSGTQQGVWSGGAMQLTTTAHERLGSGVRMPKSSSVTIEALSGSDVRDELGNDTVVEFLETRGFPTPTVEEVQTTATPRSGGEPRVSSTRFVSTPERHFTTTTPEGRVSSYVVDDQARIARVELPGQVPTTYVYDQQGIGFLDRVERRDGPRTRITSFGYDPRGYVDSIENRLSASVNDKVSMTNDSMGFATQTKVEPNFLTVDAMPDITGALATLTPETLAGTGTTHAMTYTPLGQLAQYAPPGSLTADDGVCPPGTQCWRYNRDRQLEALILSDGSVVDYGYDPIEGTLGSVTVPGHGTSEFGYDKGRRVAAWAPTQSTGSSGMTFGWQSTLPIRTTWDGDHSIDGVSGSFAVDGSVERFYNDFLEVDRILVSGEGGSLDMRLQRDRDGLVERIEDAASSWPTLDLNRSPLDGHVTGTTLGSITTTQGLDISATNPGFGDLLSLSAVAGPVDLYDASYTYDDRGRIDTWTEQIQSGASVTRKFGYDAAGRLISVHDISGGVPGTLLEEYAYDGNGNRTKATSNYPGAVALDAELGTSLGCPGAADTRAANDLDQLCHFAGRDYTYNARGQLETRVEAGVTTSYTYDGLGRLHRVTEPGLDVRYIHDALGRRIGKVKNGSLVKGWLYADALNPIAQLDENGELEAVFLYGSRAHVPDAMIMTDGSGTVYRFITDHLGSVRLVVNAQTREVVQRMEYDAFGRVLNVPQNPNLQPFGFAGGLYDHDTALVRFGARDYDAYAGRWTAKDPILFDGEQVNLYAYVWADPINRVDPDGLYTLSIGGSFSGGVFGFAGTVTFAGTFVFDASGVSESAVNVTTSRGVSGTVYYASSGIYLELTNAESLEDLRGYGEYVGRGGVGGLWGSYVQNPGCYEGLEFSYGPGVGFQFAGAGTSNTDFYYGGPWK